MAENSTSRWPIGQTTCESWGKASGDGLTGLRATALDVDLVDPNLTAVLSAGTCGTSGFATGGYCLGVPSKIRATVNPSAPAPVTKALATGVLQVE